MRIYLNAKRCQGQVLVLAAFTTLLVAICLFMTISVSWQVRNRIQLQHAADAKAFSDATYVARAYNSLAYSNRAIAGNIVSMTILHAFHSEISAASDIYMPLIVPLTAVSGIELGCGKLMCCGFFTFPCRFQHIVHSIQSILDLVKITMAYIGGKMGKWIQRTDDSFKDAIGSIETSISMLTTFQSLLQTDLVLAGLSDQNSEINKINMTSGSSVTDILSAVDTIDFESETSKKAIDLTDIVNAARPGWIRDRMNIGATILTLPMLNDSQGPLKKELGDHWVLGVTAQIPVTGGGAGFYQSKPSNWVTSIIENMGGHPKSQIEGAHISSFDSWTYVGSLKYGNCYYPVAGFTPMLEMVSPAIVTSDQQGGRHKAPAGFELFNKVHKGDSHKVDVESFFDLAVWSTEANSENNYKQPGLYAGFSTNSLSRAFDKTSGKNPWDLNIKVSLPVEGKINLENSTNNSAAGEAKAVSKAMTYYHHPGNWKEPPNLWNPFWRSKLHPYSSDDLVHLILSGGSDAMLLLFAQ